MLGKSSNRKHYVVVTTGAKDEANIALAKSYNWTLTTGST
jgi:hypothetical protein